MMKKFLALMLAAIFLSVNFSSLSFAKTPQEKQAEKEAKQEFKLQRKQDKKLAKMYRRTNILKVKEWAQNGDSQAMLILAYAYSTRQHIRKNKAEAAELRQKVSESNGDLFTNFIPIEYINRRKVDLPLLYGLAACRSQIGQYVDKNFEDAVRWAELGASEYDPLSFAVLGSMYYTGRGFRQDYKKAIEYAKLSMSYSEKNQSEPIALYILSDAYKNGNGVDMDLKKSKFYADYLKLVRQPKIDKRRAKNEKKLEKKAQAEIKAKEKADAKLNKKKSNDKSETENQTKTNDNAETENQTKTNDNSEIENQQNEEDNATLLDHPFEDS